jgi:RNA polymerase-interacting CarD/CdnL/TRCF family regulator
MQKAMIGMFQKIQPSLNNTITALNSLLETLKENQDVIIFLAKWAVRLGAAFLAYKTVMVGVGVVQGLVNIKIYENVAAMQAAKMATDSATASAAGFNIAMSTVGIFAFVAAITALIAKLIRVKQLQSEILEKNTNTKGAVGGYKSTDEVYQDLINKSNNPNLTQKEKEDLFPKQKEENCQGWSSRGFIQ